MSAESAATSYWATTATSCRTNGHLRTSAWAH